MPFFSITKHCFTQWYIKNYVDKKIFLSFSPVEMSKHGLLLCYACACLQNTCTGTLLWQMENMLSNTVGYHIPSLRDAGQLVSMPWRTTPISSIPIIPLLLVCSWWDHPWVAAAGGTGQGRGRMRGRRKESGEGSQRQILAEGHDYFMSFSLSPCSPSGVHIFKKWVWIPPWLIIDENVSIMKSTVTNNTDLVHTA